MNRPSVMYIETFACMCVCVCVEGGGGAICLIIISFLH